MKVAVICADTMTNPGNVLYRAIAIQGGPIKAAPCILHPACLYIEYNGDTSEKRLICGAYTVCCLSVCTAFSDGLYNGRRLAAVDSLQFTMWSRYTSAHSTDCQSGVERRPAVRQHCPERHLLRHRLQVRPCARPRPNARYM